MKNDLFITAALVCALALFCGCMEFAYYLGLMEETACDNVDPGTINPEWDRNHCFKDAAERKRTPETCAKIEVSAPKTKCYMELAEDLGKADLCDNLQDHPGGQDYSRLECLQRTAVASMNESVCDKMGEARYGGFFSSYDKASCYGAVRAESGKGLPPGDSAPGGDSI